VTRSELKDFLVGKFSLYMPQVDTSDGSPFDSQFLSPVLDALSVDDDADTMAFISDRLRQAYPDLVLDEKGSPLVDLFRNAPSLMLEPVRQSLQLQRQERAGLSNPSVLTEDSADDLAGNFFATRRKAGYVTVNVRLYFKTADIGVTLFLDNVAHSVSGKRYLPVAPITITKDELKKNQQGSLYFFDVTYQGEEAGSSFAVGPGDIFSVDNVPGLVKATNPVASTPADDAETPEEMAQKVLESISEKSPVIKRGINSVVLDAHPEVSGVQVIGYGDPEMIRDILTADAIEEDVPYTVPVAAGTYRVPELSEDPEVSNFPYSNVMHLLSPVGDDFVALVPRGAGKLFITAMGVDRQVWRYVVGSEGEEVEATVNDFTVHRACLLRVFPYETSGASIYMSPYATDSSDSDIIGNTSKFEFIAGGDRIYLGPVFENPPLYKTVQTTEVPDKVYSTSGFMVLASGEPVECLYEVNPPEGAGNLYLQVPGSFSLLGSGDYRLSVHKTDVDLEYEILELTRDTDTVNIWVKEGDPIRRKPGDGVLEEGESYSWAVWTADYDEAFSMDIGEIMSEFPALIVDMNTDNPLEVTTTVSECTLRVTEERSVARIGISAKPGERSLSDPISDVNYQWLGDKITDLVELAKENPDTPVDPQPYIDILRYVEPKLWTPSSSVHLGGKTDVYVFPSGGHSSARTHIARFRDSKPMIHGDDLRWSPGSVVYAEGLASFPIGVLAGTTATLTLKNGESYETYKIIEGGVSGSGSVLLDHYFSDSGSSVEYYVSLSSVSFDLLNSRILKCTGNDLISHVYSKTVITRSPAGFASVKDTLRIKDSGANDGDYVIQTINVTSSGTQFILDRVVPNAATEMSFEVFTEDTDFSLPIIQATGVSLTDSSGTSVSVPCGQPMGVLVHRDFQNGAGPVRVYFKDRTLCTSAGWLSCFRSGDRFYQVKGPNTLYTNDLTSTDDKDTAVIVNTDIGDGENWYLRTQANLVNVGSSLTECRVEALNVPVTGTTLVPPVPVSGLTLIVAIGNASNRKTVVFTGRGYLPLDDGTSFPGGVIQQINRALNGVAATTADNKLTLRCNDDLWILPCSAAAPLGLTAFVSSETAANVSANYDKPLLVEDIYVDYAEDPPMCYLRLDTQDDTPTEETLKWQLTSRDVAMTAPSDMQLDDATGYYYAEYDVEAIDPTRHEILTEGTGTSSDVWLYNEFENFTNAGVTPKCKVKLLSYDNVETITSVEGIVNDQMILMDRRANGSNPFTYTIYAGGDVSGYVLPSPEEGYDLSSGDSLDPYSVFSAPMGLGYWLTTDNPAYAYSVEDPVNLNISPWFVESSATGLLETPWVSAERASDVDYSYCQATSGVNATLNDVSSRIVVADPLAKSALPSWVLGTVTYYGGETADAITPELNASIMQLPFGAYFDISSVFTLLVKYGATDFDEPVQLFVRSLDENRVSHIVTVVDRVQIPRVGHFLPDSGLALVRG
jgi:hypothetical protein